MHKIPLNYISPIGEDNLNFLCEELYKNNRIRTENYRRFDVKRGLRNADGTGVMAGLTRICSVDGYYIRDGEKVPQEGRLIYRGIDIREIVANCRAENRFGYEDVAWLLLFGDLPTQEQLGRFRAVLARCRELPEDFIEDMIMKAPSPNIMNKVARSVLALYSFDENPEDISVANVLRQSVQLIAQIPSIMAYAYQVKRRAYDHKSMYIHQNDPSLSAAESILHTVRNDRRFTDEEAKLLDLCMILHADHGGGNNSTFTTRCVTSTGTDTYSAVAAGIGSLKGPFHGGANLKVRMMIDDIKLNVKNIRDEGQVADHLVKIIRREAGDRTGLIYGMGHAVYTLSDPRAEILKECAEKYAEKAGLGDDLYLLRLVEKLAPELLLKHKGEKKQMCANVDLYSGLVYDVLRIPRELFTPMFMAARISGWSAHRLEELCCNGRIMRPAYKSVSFSRKFVPIAKRRIDRTLPGEYVPADER